MFGLISIKELQKARSDFDWKFAMAVAFKHQRWASKDIADLVGLTLKDADLAFRVWMRFCKGGASTLPNIFFAHCAAALEWDDADLCLEWANENEATVAEMKAWRRLQRGEDVTQTEGGL